MIKEIRRRCEIAEDAGIACGPVSATAVVAEMEVEEDGTIIFLNCNWRVEAEDAIAFEVTKESIFDILTMKSDDIEKLDKIREESIEEYSSYDGDYNGDYLEQKAVLVQMVKDKILEEKLIDSGDYEDGRIDWEF